MMRNTYLRFILVLLQLSWSGQSLAFDNGRAAFKLEIDKRVIPYRVFALYVLPSQKLAIQSTDPIKIDAKKGRVKKNPNGYTFTAPEKPGLYSLEVEYKTDKIILNLFVMRPATDVKQGWLGEYHIGYYNKTPFKNLSSYQSPSGFIEVRKQDFDVQLSPHFKLGQFLSKQASGWPKYLVLRTELLLKLEFIMEQLDKAGLDAEGLVIMSGYRTPWYNKAIGNKTSSSRHLYGGAADIYIDSKPRDGVMDDLNHDGKIDREDAKFLFNLIEQWSQSHWWQQFPGGLSHYGSTPAHGPFVHVDSRGYRARW
jgi:hypothetical protein